jgi:DNA-directed RNA polymerase specialized sigma subunit
MNKTNAPERITLDALRFYIPYFKRGSSAEERILEGGLESPERNSLETQARLKKLASDRIAELAAPLISSEINKMISGSHLSYSKTLYNVLYYAGLDGMNRGLRNFDGTKLNISATNYLMQWFTVYAKRELATVEAPNGISPSRFQKYKKIAAVRKKLSAQLDRDATHQEILDYFQSGSADVKNMQGRVGSSKKRSEANQNITLELIEEQKDIEDNYLNVQLIDPLEDYSFDAKFSINDSKLFAETLFGAFSQEYGVSHKAQLVLQSELRYSLMSETDIDTILHLDLSEYKKFLFAWKALIRDSHGPFYQFLKEAENTEFGQLDAIDTIHMIDNSSKPVPSKARYQILFQKE